MLLQQIFNLVNKRTYFSRDDDEIWGAIDDAASSLYQQILAENSGFYLVWDTTSVTLQPNVEDYALPAAVKQLVRVREQPAGVSDWFTVLPADLNSQNFLDLQFGSVLSAAMDGPVSDFLYYGPYLLETDAQTAVQQYHFRFSPIPQDTRSVELVYTARYVSIVDKDSVCVIEPDGHWALVYEAAGNLLAGNDDDAAGTNFTMAQRRRIDYMKIVRNRQTQQVRQVEAYIEDMD